MVSTEVPRGNCENHEKCTQKLSPLRHVRKTLNLFILPWFPCVLLLWEGAMKKKKKTTFSVKRLAQVQQTSCMAYLLI